MYDVHELQQVVNEFLPAIKEEIAVTYEDCLTNNEYHFNIIINDRRFEFCHTLTQDEIKGQIKFFTKNAIYDAMSEYTGLMIPWGSHTGVRPVALAVKLLQTMDADEAEHTLIKDFRLSCEKAKLCVDIAHIQMPLLNKNEKSIDVYISIPFCVTRCNYCSFSLVGIEKKKHLHKDYVDCLCKEIEVVGKQIMSMGYIPRNIYFGGGTPTALSCDLLKKVLDVTVNTFPDAKEFTMEAGRADTIDEEKLEMMKKFPITRFNINPQTMCDHTLEAIGRNHSSEDVTKVFSIARKLNYNNINMDLIAGLPDETVDDFKYSLDRILELDPEDITVHTFALKRASRLKKQDYSIKGNSTADKMLEYAYDKLKANGYHPYYLYRQKNMEDNGENVGFCKPGYECVYNIDIMEENTHILAMGSGAISKRIIPDGLVRRSDPKDIEVYIDRIDDTISKSVEFFS